MSPLSPPRRSSVLGRAFDAALSQVRASTVFTTHTPVPAGIDRFPRSLVADYLATGLLAGLDPARALDLGIEDYDGGDREVFNMAVLGLDRKSTRLNSSH